MPKSTSAVRRRDTRILGALTGAPYRTAGRHLDGADGRRAVELVKAAVRARRAARGESWSAAIDKVLAGNARQLPDELFAVVSGPAEQWHLLSGVHVVFERHTDDLTQHFTGVVLGVGWGESGPVLRVVLTAPAMGCAAGGVVTVAAARWRTTPTPARVAATASRDTHCEAGRPIHGEADLPEGILATLPELALRRLRPALLQRPVASLRDAAGTASALYAVVEAEAIPTSARNAAANARRRTCATCGTTSPTPFRAAEDGRRHCPEHLDAAARRIVEATKARDRAVSALWAREVLTDPATVLVAMLAPDVRELRVRVEDVAGDVLLDDVVSPVPAPPGYRLPGRPGDPEELPDWVFGPAARALAGRRAVGSASLTASLNHRLLTVDAEPGRRPLAVVERPGDNLWRRYLAWTGERDLGGTYEHDDPFRSWWNGFDDEETDTDPVVVLGAVRGRLGAMAATPLDDRRREYAHRLLTDRYAPEYDDPFSFRRRRRSARRLVEVLEVFGR